MWELSLRFIYVQSHVRWGAGQPAVLQRVAAHPLQGPSRESPGDDTLRILLMPFCMAFLDTQGEAPVQAVPLHMFTLRGGDSGCRGIPEGETDAIATGKEMNAFSPLPPW